MSWLAPGSVQRAPTRPTSCKLGRLLPARCKVGHLLHAKFFFGTSLELRVRYLLTHLDHVTNPIQAILVRSDMFDTSITADLGMWMHVSGSAGPFGVPVALQADCRPEGDMM